MQPDLIAALDSNRALLAQGATAIERLGQHTFAHARPGHSSIGAHVRHVLDHYDCLLAGLPGGRVDYDARARHANTERRADKALTRLRATMEALGTLTTADGSHTVTVNAASATHHTGEAAWTPSTLTRELGFLQSHTVHHYALIKLLAELEGVGLDPDFGVAPSTLAHLRRHT